MAEPEIRAFISDLASKKQVTAATQTVALRAILFLYREVLKKELPFIHGIERAKKAERRPVVFTQAEVKEVLSRLDGVNYLIATLLYGAGLRLMDALRLRVKDIDFERNEITIREWKGEKDRVTMLPQAIKSQLRDHVDRVRMIHQSDLRNGFGEVYLPYALGRKYRHLEKDWRWQYVFPSPVLSLDPLVQQHGRALRSRVRSASLPLGVLTRARGSDTAAPGVVLTSF